LDWLFELEKTVRQTKPNFGMQGIRLKPSGKPNPIPIGFPNPENRPTIGFLKGYLGVATSA
jgi:hypothetical protein